MRIVSPLRSFWLFIFGAKPNENGWEGRVLIVNLEGIGDLVMFTSALKHYKNRLPGKKIYLLIKEGTGMEKVFKGSFADEVFTVNYRKFAVNPLYGFSLINGLRRTGFAEVINHDFSAAEILGKIIAVQVGARDVVGYEGQRIEFEKPFDFQQAQNLKMVKRNIFPRYTKLILASSGERAGSEFLPSEVGYYKEIYEGATGAVENDYSTTIKTSGDKSVLQKFGLKENGYVVLNVNSSVPYKRWPLERFSRIAEYFDSANLPVVLIGSRGDTELVDKLVSISKVKTINTAGATNFGELVGLIANCFMLFSNDTMAVHLAVALRKPSFCVGAGGQVGAMDYGYRDINFWAYKKKACFMDNWHCARGMPAGAPAPCIGAVTVEEVMEKLVRFVGYLKSGAKYPREGFSLKF